MMTMNALIRYQLEFRRIYASCLAEVCEQYDMKTEEMDILLYLANNPEFDTVSELVDRLNISKPQASITLQHLEAQGLIRKFYKDGNRKTLHLMPSEHAGTVVKAGRKAQEKCCALLMDGFSEEEAETAVRLSRRVIDNIRRYNNSKE